ncbi:GGDEF domain-containing protein [Motiliproteus sediminis]|uniref:GGDEF domain-containing protein n=1 Tax=Motiliproteus sediminis TaxID=1468178 RepID=UPI001AEFB8A5|nr:diguanylate cyclase [Motiliproteus sediminis]
MDNQSYRQPPSQPPERVRFPWRIFSLVGVATVVLLLVIGYSFRLGHHMTAQYAPLIGAAQSLRIETTLAHLWLEEILSGDDSEEFATVEGHLHAARTYAKLMLQGGEYRDGLYLPLSDPLLRRQVENLQSSLGRIEAITRQRYQALGSDAPGSPIDRQFDTTFRQFSTQADGVATELKKQVNAELNRFRQLQFSLIAGCVLLAGLLLLTLYRYERQRVRHLRTIYRTNQLLDRLSLTDGLTGIPNRRYFDQQLAAEWQRAQREQTPLTLVMVDIDYFKLYNDHYGHQQGDHCLQQVASALEYFCQRPADVAARYGGEEFALILPNTAGAEAQIDRLGAAIEALNIPHLNSPIASHITASIGYCTLLPQAGHSSAQLVEAADGALYRAKHSGRNRSEACCLPDDA